jgi:hypothetical protein
MQKNLTLSPQPEARQTVRLNIDTKDATSSIRISFTDQRLTAHGGMIVWWHLLHQRTFRAPLAEHLPHDPTSPNAYEPTDIALGYCGGILAGADKLSRVHRTAVDALPSLKEGCTLDLDSWALLHEVGHHEGVAVGYTKRGIKPAHRPLIAALAEARLIANYWLRSGSTPCVNGAAEFLRTTLAQLPRHLRLGLLRAAVWSGVVREASRR